MGKSTPIHALAELFLKKRDLKLRHAALLLVLCGGALGFLLLATRGHTCPDSKASNLWCNLQSIRSQIELYRLQHGGRLPGNSPGVRIQEQLTGKTNADGTLNPNGLFGPYLQMFPENPYTGTSTVNTAGSDNGWDYNPATGEFTADNAEGWGTEDAVFAGATDDG